VADADAAADAAIHAAIVLGADLHDGGWWWEAHEAWELAWRAWPRESPRARLLQALIQDAAAWLQLERGRPAGVARLLARAAANRRRALADAPADRTWLGLDHVRRHEQVADYLAGRSGHDAGAFPALPARFPAAGVP
jgi:predicted metal-dependent hydrolase